MTLYGGGLGWKITVGRDGEDDKTSFHNTIWRRPGMEKNGWVGTVVKKNQLSWQYVVVAWYGKSLLAGRGCKTKPAFITLYGGGLVWKIKVNRIVTSFSFNQKRLFVLTKQVTVTTKVTGLEHIHRRKNTFVAISVQVPFSGTREHFSPALLEFACIREHHAEE